MLITLLYKMDSNYSPPVQFSHELMVNISEVCASDKYVFELYRIIVPTLFSVIIAVGCVGNALVIHVICRYPGRLLDISEGLFQDFFKMATRFCCPAIGFVDASILYTV